MCLSGLVAPEEINLHDARIDGDLHAQSTDDHSTKFGRVTADNLKVTGTLDFTGVEIACTDDKPCLDLSFAEVQGDCHLPGGNGSVRALNLYHAKLGEVEFAGGGLPAVTADGMTFRRLTVPRPDGIPPGDEYVHFLEHTRPFQKGTYEVVENYLRERGEDETADRVFREMRRRDRRQELPGWLFAADVWLYEGSKGRVKELAARRAAEQADAPPRPATSPARSAASTASSAGSWAFSSSTCSPATAPGPTASASTCWSCSP